MPGKFTVAPAAILTAEVKCEFELMVVTAPASIVRLVPIVNELPALIVKVV